jgi:hypothetical protein
MTNEDIIRMAREARLAEHTHPYQLWSASDDGLERFANLVAAAEREACAVIAFNAKTYLEAAEAIRARGQHD